MPDPGVQTFDSVHGATANGAASNKKEEVSSR